MASPKATSAGVGPAAAVTVATVCVATPEKVTVSPSVIVSVVTPSETIQE